MVVSARLFRCCALLVAIASAALLASPALAAKPSRAPAGLAFYNPPKHLPGHNHGDLIWARTVPSVLPSARKTYLVLFRSIGLNGKPIAVSGTVAIPRGGAPKNGWPVISYANGTTGSARICAPSRDSATSPVHPLVAYSYPVLDGWVKSGYAVARADYPGLGAPGPDSYLIGGLEAHSVIDIVRAARQLHRKIGKRWAVAGHSQGGHAALWAAAEGPTWARDLHLVGAVAFAPASHVATEVNAAGALTSPSGLSALGALILKAAGTASPSVRLSQLVSPKAAALLGQVDQFCLPQLEQPTSWAGLAPSEILNSGADLMPLDNVLAANDPGQLKIGVPTLLLQGDMDTTVFPSFTADLNKQLTALGDRVDYRVYPGVNHGGIVAAAAPAATPWLARRFR